MKILILLVTFLTTTTSFAERENNIANIGYGCICSNYQITEGNIKIISKLISFVSYHEGEVPESLRRRDFKKLCNESIQFKERIFCKALVDLNIESISSVIKATDFVEQSEEMQSELSYLKMTRGPL